VRRTLGLGAIALATTVLLGACSDDDGPEQLSTEGSTAAPASPAAPAAPPGPAAAAGFMPVSDVAPHAAIGTDVAAAKALLDAVKAGQPVDWAGVRRAFTAGGASLKSDGSVRTLEKLVEAPATVAFVLEAVDGTGASAGASDAVRAQRVDKGISVLLAAKVRQELGAAATKLADGKLDPATGAAHNVDEAWAFFTAGGNGLVSTAGKRAADFGRDGAVAEPVLAALAGAQQAALAGDAAALAARTAEVGAALDYIFYLATHKYLDTGGKEATRAEGETFYLGIRPAVQAAAPDADAAITAAFASGDAAAGRAALRQPAVLAALGVDGAERVDQG